LNPAARNSPATAYHVEADRLQLGARLRGRDAARVRWSIGLLEAHLAGAVLRRAARQRY